MCLHPDPRLRPTLAGIMGALAGAPVVAGPVFASAANMPPLPHATAVTGVYPTPTVPTIPTVATTPTGALGAATFATVATAPVAGPPTMPAVPGSNPNIPLVLPMGARPASVGGGASRSGSEALAIAIKWVASHRLEAAGLLLVIAAIVTIVVVRGVNGGGGGGGFGGDSAKSLYDEGVKAIQEGHELTARDKFTEALKKGSGAAARQLADLEPDANTKKELLRQGADLGDEDCKRMLQEIEAAERQPVRRQPNYYQPRPY